MLFHEVSIMKKSILFFFPLFAGILLSLPSWSAEPLNVCLVSGSAEYDSDTCLTLFKQHLESRYNARCTLLKAQGFHALPGLEALDTCDVALFYTRRLVIDGEPLERIKKYCESGRPIVAVRTASHGFQNWLAFDKEILGGNYNNHFGDEYTQSASVTPEAKNHPVMEGVVNFRSVYSLYRTAPVAEDATVLLTSSIPTEKTGQPAAWVRMNRGGRVFYTSLGGLEDFHNATYLRLLSNALFWAANRPVEAKPLPEITERPRSTGEFTLRLRAQVKPYKGLDQWRETEFEQTFRIPETAILICDMWNRHWCDGATARCEALAVRLNQVLEFAREKGILIIHSPSETMEAYADWPQRRRIQMIPRIGVPALVDVEEPPLPIDDSDGGCDTDNPIQYGAWSSQSPLLGIGEYDVISDNGDEIYAYLKQQGIQNILYTGVHTNMCVLGRSFAIRRMTRLGFQCVLMRDLTDAMYDPRDKPFVNHAIGTQLVVKHIEKFWCPSALGSDLMESLLYSRED